MEKAGYHTPKKALNKQKNCSLFMPKRSPVKSIERSIFSIPYKVIKKLNNNNDLRNLSPSIKKKRRRFFSVETIPEEQEKKGINNKNMEENKNDYFVNFTKDVYINESHLSKNNIIKSPRKKDNSFIKKYQEQNNIFLNQLNKFNKMIF